MREDPQNDLFGKRQVSYNKASACKKWTQVHRKEILTKNDLKLRLQFTRKVCRKRAMCNYEI